MSSDVLLGLVLGGGLGLANALASLLLYRVARSRSNRTFQRLVFGGMLVRMAAVLLLVALVVWLAPVDLFVFLVALLSVFVLGLAADVTYMVKHPAHPRSGRPSGSAASQTRNRS